MTITEAVAAIKELDRLYMVAQATGRTDDWDRYHVARANYERATP